VDASLSKVLFLISKELGMNIVFSDDVDSAQKITLNMIGATAKDALDVAMDISDNYYEIQGNIIYVKKYKSEVFKLPFVNSSTVKNSALGGNMLGSKDSSMSGTNKLDYTSDAEANNYYAQLENNLKNILTEKPEKEVAAQKDANASNNSTGISELPKQDKAGRFSLNKYTGTLIVTDTKSKIEQVRKLVEDIAMFTSKQVLIEAKVFEVVLSDSHQLGIDWSRAWTFAGSSVLASQALNTVNGVVGGAQSPISSANAVALQYSSDNFNAIIKAIQGSGETEIVSNPRINVLNGQSGILASGNVIPYWEKSVTYASQQDPNDTTKFILTPTVVYDKVEVLNGISLSVTPVIREDGSIVVNIVPIITNIEGDKTFTDEGKDVATAPILNIKEAGTTIITQDDSMIVIGGLISSSDKDEVFKTPILGDIPFVGDAFFKRTEKAKERRELVIILKINVNDRNL